MNINKLSFAFTTAIVIALIFSGFNLLAAPSVVSAQTPLYKSCEEDKLTAPLSLTAANDATPEATAEAMAATQAAAAPSGSDDIAFLSIVGSESQACYLTTETFLQGNFMNLPAGFNGAVGITKTISGDIALDRTNVANSQMGDININVSELKSDNDRRDGFIRQNFLQSNKYPFATLTDITVMGLPTGAYQDGAALKFQIKGTLTAHDTKRETVFDATGTFTGGTLVVRAVTDLNMSDFGIKVPDIGGLLKVEDAMRLVVNIVARESQSTATPAK
ncbi:MAG: YceI family protein [Chloroflexota bacterium]